MTEPCPWCGGTDHPSLQCPRVKAFDFDVAMNVMRVEFLTPADCLPPRRDDKPTDEDDYPKLKPMGGT